jgi:hypothetical protein
LLKHSTVRLLLFAALPCALATLIRGHADAHVARAHASAAADGLAVPPITVRPFASGSKNGVTNPDPIVVTKQHVYIAYQNNTPPTGGPLDSTIIQYDRAGHALQTLNVPSRTLRHQPAIALRQALPLRLADAARRRLRRSRL